MNRFVAAVAAVLLVPLPAHAANILLVMDSRTGAPIATALMADGHTVTSMMGAFVGDFSTGTVPALMGDLSEYDAVYWVQDGTGGGNPVTDAALFTNLTDYVSSGGRVFVTGYDSIASPTDPMLIAFVGGTGAIDVPGPPGMVEMVDCTLTTGVVDIRGLVPVGADGDTDELTGLSADTIRVAGTSRGGTGAQFSLRTLGAGEVAYVANGGDSVAWTTTGGGGAGVFNALLRNFAAAADAAATEPGAPEIEFARLLGVDEGDAVMLEVTVRDLEGDPFTFSWDTDDDGTFGELMGMTTFMIPEGTTDGPEAIAIAVQATDGMHTATRTRTIRVGNVAPRITSMPPTVISVGAAMRYAVTVEDPGGERDPLTYSIMRGPSSAAFMGSTLTWTPADGDVTMGDERVTFEISVDDGDLGVGTQMFQLQVSPNRLPSNVMLLYPANGIVIANPMPRLVVQDGTDPDPFDRLTYSFELDDDDTFADPLVSALMLPEEPGFTAHQLTEPLPPGHYYWRAWAFDGSAESANRVMTDFYVAGAPVDAPAAGADVGVSRPDAGTMAPRGDCSCRAAGRSTSAPLALAGLLALFVIRMRRRPR